MSRRFSAPLGKRVQIKRFRTFARNRQNGFAALGNCFIKTSLRGRGRSYRHDLTGRPGTVAKHGPAAQPRRASPVWRRYPPIWRREPASYRSEAEYHHGDDVWRSHSVHDPVASLSQLRSPGSADVPDADDPRAPGDHSSGGFLFYATAMGDVGPSDRQDCKMGSDELASNGSAETPKNQRKRPRPDGRRSSVRLKFPSVS
jgi:hypothetical protein